MSYSKNTILLLVLWISLAGSSTVSDDNDVLTTPQFRKGLPQFFEKMATGDSVVVAFLGGSITAANGGWRDQTMDWLGHRFPNTPMEQVNAGVGGTGSDLGVFRLHKDVMAYHPDLVFVEFAVNDEGKSPEIVKRAMEGIVRKLRKANPNVDICFVYTMMESMVPILAAGELTTTMQAMEQIARHYGLPSVFLGEGAIRDYKNKRLVMRGEEAEHARHVVFSKDGVHPYPETGHRLYAAALTAAMPKIQQVGKLSTRQLPDPVDRMNWEDAQLVSPLTLTREGKWERVCEMDTTLPVHVKEAFPDLLRGQAEDQPALTITFRGKAVGLYDIVGPGTGQVEITIDGKEVERKMRFDRYSTYYRAQYFLLPELDDARHTVSFRVSQDQFDKFTILGDNAPGTGQRNRYDHYAIYIGYVMVLGEL